MNINNVTFERSFGVSSQLTPSTMPEIAFAGRSNVGKSSLLNRLFNRKGLAKVSQTPGKTATINFFSCDGVRFVDLPGYGFAVVLTKADKLSRQQQMKQKAALKKQLKLGADVPLVVCSSEKGIGIDELRSLIKNSVR